MTKQTCSIVRPVAAIGMLLTLAAPAIGQLIQDDLTLNFDANRDVDGNGRWESTVSGSLLDLRPIRLSSAPPHP